MKLEIRLTIREKFVVGGRRFEHPEEDKAVHL